MPDFVGTSNDEALITLRRSGDTFPRLSIEADGSIKYGTGAAFPSASPYPGVIVPPANVDSVMNTAYFTDQVHPNALGQLQMARLVRNYI